jgi:hypothetical protein
MRLPIGRSLVVGRGFDAEQVQTLLAVVEAAILIGLFKHPAHGEGSFPEVPNSSMFVLHEWLCHARKTICRKVLEMR